MSIACLSGSLAILSSSDALAQAKQTTPAQAAPAPAPEAAVKQMALTEKQIEGVLTAAKDMDAITAKLVDNAKPDPTMAAQFEGVARKNGFAGYDEYSNVLDNISIVLAGFDPATKQYVGSDAVIKAQIAQVEADFAGQGYGDLKKAVAEVVVDAVTPFRERMAELLADPAELDRIL